METITGFKKFTNAFYVYKFFKDFAFIYAVYVILFRLRGLSIFEVSILIAIWSAFIVLFEVPTGALADKYNRKHMMIIGMLFKAIGFGIWIFANSFSLFALGFLFCAVQITFCSGTQEALLYDNLKKFKKENQYEKISGKGHFYSSIAIGSSMFLGGFLGAYSFTLTLLLSSFAMVISIIPIFFFHEVKYRKTSTKEVKYIDYIKNAFKESASNKKLLNFLLYSMVIIAIVMSLDEFSQLFYEWVGLPIMFFGAAALVMMIFDAFGSRLAYKFNKRYSNQNMIYLLSIVASILLICSLFYNSFIMLIPFLLIFFFIAICRVLVESGIQKEIRTDQRATIMSINSLLVHLSAVFLAVFFGIVSELMSLRWGFAAFAFIILGFSIFSIFWNLKRKYKEAIKNKQ